MTSSKVELERRRFLKLVGASALTYPFLRGVPSFARENALMDITKYVNALPCKAALSPGHLQLATANGKYFGVPYLADLSVLWYNKALFRQAGLDPNQPPTSYAQIVSDAEKINALGHGISGFSFAGNCQGCLGFTMLPSLWADGQHLIKGPLGNQTANVSGDAPLKDMLSAYRTMWAKHLVPAADQTQNFNTQAGLVRITPIYHATALIVQGRDNIYIGSQDDQDAVFRVWPIAGQPQRIPARWKKQGEQGERSD